MIKQIKNLSINLEDLLKFTKELMPFKLNSPYGDCNSLEINKSADSLFLSKCWLEYTMNKVFSSYYKDVKSTTVSFEDNNKFLKGFNHNEKVEWLIKEIKTISTEIINIINQLDIEKMYKDNITIHLLEAEFWLDAELSRIRDKNNIIYNMPITYKRESDTLESIKAKQNKGDIVRVKIQIPLTTEQTWEDIREIEKTTLLNLGIIIDKNYLYEGVSPGLINRDGTFPKVVDSLFDGYLLILSKL